MTRPQTRQRQLSASREFAHDTESVIESARRTRESLSSVVKLAERRRREVTRIDDAGFEAIGWERLTPGDRCQALYSALTWLQKAENEMRQTRLFLERAIEHTERRSL